jgi:hypothetical protein
VKKILSILIFVFATQLQAKETIVVMNPQGPSFSGAAQLLAVVEESNKLQNKYNFVVEFKVGAFESIALRELNDHPQSKIATITTASIEGFERGLSNLGSLKPIFSQGDCCWAVVALVDKNNGLDSIKDLDEIVVGTPAVGGVAHLVALELGKKYNKPVRQIVYRSGNDAIIGMIANDGVNFTIERVRNYESFKSRSKNLQMLAMSCPVRHPDAPNLKTLREYGIDTPYIWQHIVADTRLSDEKSQDFERIFAEATRKIGLKTIQSLSDQTPPIFNNVDSKTHFNQSITKLTSYREKFRSEINASR